MSRFRDPLDYDYGASVTDRGRAVASNSSNSDAGGLAIPITAVAATTEDYCVFSAESEFYLLRGDPGVGGILGNVSSQIGIGSRTAWCRLPDGSIVFLSRDGLYRYHPSQPLPQNISRDKLPTEGMCATGVFTFTSCPAQRVRPRIIGSIGKHRVSQP
jgi:hypothetical protein